MSAIPILAAQPWVERLGLTLLHFLWQGAIVAAIYAAARIWGAQKLGPNGRYFLARAALTAMAIAPIVTWILLRGSAPDSAALTFRAPMSAVRIDPPRPIFPPLPSDVYPVTPGRLLPWVVAFWLVGATAFSLRLLSGWILAERLRCKKVRPAPPEWQRTLDRRSGERRRTCPVGNCRMDRVRPTGRPAAV